MYAEGMAINACMSLYDVFIILSGLCIIRPIIDMLIPPDPGCWSLSRLFRCRA